MTRFFFPFVHNLFTQMNGLSSSLIFDYNHTVDTQSSTHISYWHLVQFEHSKHHSSCLINSKSYSLFVAAQSNKTAVSPPDSQSAKTVLTGLQSATSAHIWRLFITGHQLRSVCQRSMWDWYLSELLTLSMIVLQMQQRFLSGQGRQS